MQTKTTLSENIAIYGLLVLIILAMSNGCNDVSSGVGDDCQAPLSTQTMRYKWSEVIMISYYCQERASQNMTRCLDEGLQPSDLCIQDQQLEQKRCIYWYGRGVNKIPLRECGAEIFTIIGNPDDLGPDIHPISANLDVDTDGDGISNYWEFMMGYNPCTPNSFGCDFPPDGTDDFDADGYIDAEDEYPMCNATYQGDPDALPDPAEYNFDCF